MLSSFEIPCTDVKLNCTLLTQRQVKHSFEPMWASLLSPLTWSSALAMSSSLLTNTSLHSKFASLVPLQLNPSCPPLTPLPASDSLLTPFHQHNPLQHTHTRPCLCVNVCVSLHRLGSVRRPSHDWQPHSHIAVLHLAIGSFTLPVGSIHLLFFSLLGKGQTGKEGNI